MNNFQKDIINEFWKWVLEHQDNETIVDYDGNKELCIWVDFYDLDDFTERYVSDSENRIPTILFNGHVCIKAVDFLGGYGFSMDDVWLYKPNGLSDKLKVN